MKQIYIMVGPPACGKSTWIKNNLKDPYIISRDDLADSITNKLGWSYSDMFVKPPHNASMFDKHPKFGEVIRPHKQLQYSNIHNANMELNARFMNMKYNCLKSDKNLVVDLAHMTKSSRTSSLNIVRAGGYEKIAVVFNFEGKEKQIKDVADKRAYETGKTISAEIYTQMYGSYKKPELSEGFDKIIEVQLYE